MSTLEPPTGPLYDNPCTDCGATAGARCTAAGVDLICIVHPARYEALRLGAHA